MAAISHDPSCNLNLRILIGRQGACTLKAGLKCEVVHIAVAETRRDDVGQKKRLGKVDFNVNLHRTIESHLRELSSYLFIPHGFLKRLSAPQAQGDVVSVEEISVRIEGGVFT